MNINDTCMTIYKWLVIIMSVSYIATASDLELTFSSVTAVKMEANIQIVVHW